MIRAVNYAMVTILLSLATQAAAATNTMTSVTKAGLLQHLKERVRVRAFSELMGPSLRSKPGNAAAVPGPNGEELDAPNMFTIVQADYAFMKNSRLLIFQRMTSNLGPAAGLSGGNFRLLDPRVGWRQSNIIPSKNFQASVLDFYTQVPLSSRSQEQQRTLDLGVQANFTYTVPKSKWTLGLITDIRGSIYRAAQGNNNFQGFFAPWGSYELSRKFSTQHWLNMPWRHKQEDPWDSVAWAFPGRPYIQNGIGFSANKFLWFSLMVNNYVDTAPNLQNTWASLWVSVSAL